MKSIVTLMFLGAIILFLPFQGNSQTRSISKYAGSLNLISYKPKWFDTLNALPSDIKEKVVKHLIDRLGEDFYSELKLNYLIVVNFDDFRRAESNPTYQWKIPAYEVGFSFVRRDKGIKDYEANIQFDESGAVLREIDLPPIRLDPEKAEIIPVKTAIKIGRANKFSTEWVRIAYREEDDSIVWQLHRRDKDGGTLRMDISAHTGKILNTVGWIGIR